MRSGFDRARRAGKLIVGLNFLHRRLNFLHDRQRLPVDRLVERSHNVDRPDVEMDVGNRVVFAAERFGQPTTAILAR